MKRTERSHSISAAEVPRGCASGLGIGSHADNQAIREPLFWGNGVTTSCAPKTDASGPPDDVATSTCKRCLPHPGQSLADLSQHLRDTHLAYAHPNLYRNLPDRRDRWRWGPNSNSYAAWMAGCCHDFDRSGLGRLPGWNHGPAGPCSEDPQSASAAPGEEGPAEPGSSGDGPRDAGAEPAAGVPEAPEGATPGATSTDIDPNADGTVGPEPKNPPWPNGASTFGDVDRAPLTGHYHQIGKGTPMT